MADSNLLQRLPKIGRKMVNKDLPRIDCDTGMPDCLCKRLWKIR